MNELHRGLGFAASINADAPETHDNPSLAQDLLLILFQPRSGTIAGEGTLHYVLAGAVLAELELGGHVSTGTGRTGAMTVEAVVGNPPADPLFRDSWEYIAKKPRSAQTVLAAMGPTLRQPLLDRLVEHGDIHQNVRKVLGLFETVTFKDGGTGRRDRLIDAVRAVLVDGSEAAPRIVVLAALLYGSGTLPQFDSEIPWTSAVISRAEELKAGNWGADAAANAVARTVAATVVGLALSALPTTSQH